MFAAVLSPEAPTPIGPYSQAVRCGDWVFLSGQIPLDPVTGQLAGTTTVDQTHQVLANLRAVLQAADLEPRHLVRTTIYLLDLADFPAVNELYGAFLAASPVPPARSTVQVAGLPRGARIEIDAIALRS